MKQYLLDTDICIYLLNRSHPTLEIKLRSLSARQLAISTITEAELYYGAEHSSRAEENRTRVTRFLHPLDKHPFHSNAARIFARIKDQLIKQGRMVGLMDALIASIAIAEDTILVTNNAREFQRIPELQCESWLHN